MKKFYAAIILFALALPLFPQSGAFGTVKGDPVELYNTGRDLESRGRNLEADIYYEQAIQICNSDISQNSANRNTYTAMTWALLRLRRYGEVITWGERGLRIYSDEYRIVESMGEAYFYLDDYVSSLRFMQRYANAQPRGDRVSVAYFFMGEIYRLTGKFLLADIAYSTAVRLSPSNSLWWYRLGVAREYAGEPLSAADAYERAVRLNPEYQAASDSLARVRRQSR